MHRVIHFIDSGWEYRPLYGKKVSLEALARGRPAPCSQGAFVLQFPGAMSRTPLRRESMKNTLTLLAVGLSLAFGAAQAADNKQQSKMTECNKQAADKKGDERKAFMKTCLSAKKETPQQAKMKTCNIEAKDKKGDERKKFMSECLKG
jgi:psiF repeat